IDLLNLSDSDIESLASACEPATFDASSESDPSHHEVLKMDKENFATNFELTQADIGLDILSFIENNFLEGTSETMEYIRAEIHQLNMYGKDSLIKRHKYSREKEINFGSLVVVFSTATSSEGGELTFFYHNKSWTWDSAKILRNAEPRTIAYVAFRNNIDISLSPVTKGHQVMLTYKLYCIDRENAENLVISPSIISEESTFRSALYNALKDPKFLPNGGYLGFGLCYAYSFDEDFSDLKNLKQFLKGRDAMTLNVCTSLELDANVKAVY
ncbi:hypothetical protein BDQ17DRAFT_1194846, partial [Cyathus striatus]